ncbi:MAG TPA: hypothetical protein VD999_02940 [Vitreimonas sp.]|nr:hypothetical protein [Vitreimonas sp.]
MVSKIERDLNDDEERRRQEQLEQFRKAQQLRAQQDEASRLKQLATDQERIRQAQANPLYAEFLAVPDDIELMNCLTTVRNRNPEIYYFIKEPRPIQATAAEPLGRVVVKINYKDGTQRDFITIRYEEGLIQVGSTSQKKSSLRFSVTGPYSRMEEYDEVTDAGKSDVYTMRVFSVTTLDFDSSSRLMAFILSDPWIAKKFDVVPPQRW